MLNLKDGTLWQWDTGRKLIVTLDEGSTIDKIQYYNGTSDIAYTGTVESIEGVLLSPIPDFLLQSSNNLTIYLMTTTKSGVKTQESVTLKVNKRGKPEDYVYTEEEEALTYKRMQEEFALLQKNFGELESDVDEFMEEYGDKALAQIDKWLDEHPEATTTVQDNSLTIDKMVVGTLGYVTPEMFGARGDGVTDDTKAIQDAVNCDLPVRFAKQNGIYCISETITVNGIIDFIMENGSVIKVTSTIETAIIFTNIPVYLDATEPFSIIQLHLDCDYKAEIGVTIDGLRTDGKSNFIIENFNDIGLKVTDKKTGSNLGNVRCDCRSKNNNYFANYGIYSEATDNLYNFVVAVNCLNGCKFGNAATVVLYHPWRSNYPDSSKGVTKCWIPEALTTIHTLINDSLQYCIYNTNPNVYDWCVNNILSFGTQTGEKHVVVYNECENVRGHIGYLSCQSTENWYLTETKDGVSSVRRWRGLSIGKMGIAGQGYLEDMDSPNYLPQGNFKTTDNNGGWIVDQISNVGLKRAFDLTAETDFINVAHMHYDNRTDRRILLAKNNQAFFSKSPTMIKGESTGSIFYNNNGVLTQITALLNVTPDSSNAFELQANCPYKCLDGDYWCAVATTKSSNDMQLLNCKITNNVLSISGHNAGECYLSINLVVSA